MRQIEIQPIPNQSFSVRLDNNLYNIVIKESRGIMGLTMSRNNVKILDSVRLTAGFRIIPYLYEESGNFVITNINDDLIYYDKFGVSQFLYYVSSAELLTIRAT